MRALLSAALITSAFCNAQNVITVYYCVPPDQGCDGYCALDLAAWQECSNGSSYNYDPFGCVDFDPTFTDGDTLFIGICADPCTITMTDGLGNACICQLTSLIPTAIPAHATTLVASRVGGLLRVRSDLPMVDPVLSVFDATGRRTMQHQLTSGTNWEVPIDDAAIGLRVLVVETEGQRLVARF